MARRLLILVSFLILLQGCGEGEKEEVGGVVITENIVSNTTWQSGKVYLIKTWDLGVEATLIIEPGVIVKFTPDGQSLTLGDNGTIIAGGTPQDPIVFTSYKDDAHGGDTNGDGDSTQPAAGDWYSINTNGQQGSIFDHCEFYYGGGGPYDSTLDLFSSRATVTNCVFAHNRGGENGVLDASAALSGTIIKGNTFYDNEKPILINTTFDIDDSNTFHNPDDLSQTNLLNGIFLDYPDAIENRHITWLETEVPFVIDHNDFWIDETGSLTLGDNVIIKFMPDSTLNHYGNLINHDGAGVFFTSYKDDAHGGDTNGDGSATVPGDGDWDGIYNDNTGEYETWGNILYDQH